VSWGALFERAGNDRTTTEAIMDTLAAVRWSGDAEGRGRTGDERDGREHDDWERDE
jgi:hypothetical protein